MTLDLYRQGYSLEQIASERELAINTIKEHLLALLAIGEEIDVTPYVNTRFKEVIEAAISQYGIASIRVLKEALPEEVDYFDIKYYVAKQGKGTN